ncbi:SDR family NAD(P)-dependent oxidoreductase [uncultured Sulfitobacter sp.]|jgi:retinol dehydrogenase-14|uniref:SDR family NAD(P)-dependent oxidoreductase n=1 Tax=uncultured Sulfitobacter sp. TaxID=191468 RepID=UPI00161EC7E9|tara:strand:- start:10949 stop:11932 length:984 start_codon:yes stop_codon:yes gene_type:complete
MPLISDRTRITINLFLPQRRTPDPRHAIPQADRDLTGKTIVMTGGTDGIGRVAAGMLCDMGANLVLLGRRQAVGDRVIRELAATGGAGTVSFQVCDLASMDSVKACAERILAAHDRIDVLINGAGVNATRPTFTEDGFEMNWAVNYLAPILLTRLLADRITASAPARIVYLVTNLAFLDRINMDEIAAKPDFATSEAYVESKLSGSMFMIDLAQELESKGVTVNYLHPGNIRSNLLRDLTGAERIMGYVIRVAASPTEVGADRIVRLAASSEFDGITGAYLVEDTIRPAHPEAQNASLRKQLSRITERTLKNWLPADEPASGEAVLL